MKLLVDADSAIFKAGLSNEQRYYSVYVEGKVVHQCVYKKEALEWQELHLGRNTERVIVKEKSLKGPLSHSLANLKRVCENMLSFPHTSYQMYISGKNNFRYKIYDKYKANRTDSDRPIHEPELREYLTRVWNAEVVDNEEVDDKVSYLQCQAKEDTCIVSIDKDLLNTPGKHYNYDKQSLITLTEEEANLNFIRQLLTGDKTDNIPGIDGVGEKTANRIFQRYTKDWYDMVHRHYIDGQRKGKVEEGDIHAIIMRNARLLWMRREPNQIFQKEMV